MSSEPRTYAEIANAAVARFRQKCAAPFDDSATTLQAGSFHRTVEVLEELLAEHWQKAIDMLAADVNAQGPKIVLRRLECPVAVTFGSGAGPRLIVQYVPPAITDEGRVVEGYTSARFDVAGVAVGAGEPPSPQ